MPSLRKAGVWNDPGRVPATLARQAGTRFGGAGNGGRQIQKRRRPTKAGSWMLSFDNPVSGVLPGNAVLRGDVPGRLRAAPGDFRPRFRLSARRKPKNPAIPEPQSRTSAARRLFSLSVYIAARPAAGSRFAGAPPPRGALFVSQTPTDQTACKYPPRPSRSVRRPDAIPGSDTRQSVKDSPAPRQRYAPPFR